MTRVFGPIFQADLVRLRDLVESGAGLSRGRRPHAAPPRRRHLRAVPGALRAATAGPRARRDQPVGRLGARATSCCTSSARRARRTSAAPRTGSSSRSATTSSPATSRRPGCRPSCSPSSRSPRRPSRRSASSCGRWSSSRPTTRSPPRPSASPRTRGSSGSSSARPTRTWPSSSATTGSCCGTVAGTSIYDDAGVRAKWGVAAAPRSRTTSPSSAMPRTAIRGCPAGARSRPRPCSAATATSRTIPPKASAWEVPGLGGTRAIALAATLRERLGRGAALSRSGPAPDRRRRRARSARRDPDELRWDGAPRAGVGGVLRGMGPGAAARPPASLAARLELTRAAGRQRTEARAAPRGGRPARRGCRSTSGLGDVEPRAAVHRGDARPAPLGDEPGGRDVPGRQPALLDEGVEPAVADVRERERRRAHRARDADRPCGRCGRATVAVRPLSAIEMTKSESLSLSEAWIGRPSRIAGPSAVAANDSSRVGSTDDTDDRPAVDHQPDRDAEERDAVGVVHRAVERVDDPHPATPRGGRLARDRPMLAGLLGQDRVGRVASPGSRRG